MLYLYFNNQPAVEVAESDAWYGQSFHIVPRSSHAYTYAINSNSSSISMTILQHQHQQHIQIIKENKTK